MPIGPDDSHNVEFQRFGEAKLPEFDIPYHTEIMERFDGIDTVSYTHLDVYKRQTQILHGEENRAKSLASNATSETVEASRGIITDRNGNCLLYTSRCV